MTILENICCFELETLAICVAILGIFGSLLSSKILVNATYDEIYFSRIVIFSIWIHVAIIHGTINRNHYYLLPWLITSVVAYVVIGILIYSISIEMMIAVSGDADQDRSVKLFAAILVIVTILLIHSYFYMIIYSLYIKIKNEQLADQSIFQFGYHT